MREKFAISRKGSDSGGTYTRNLPIQSNRAFMSGFTLMDSFIMTTTTPITMHSQPKTWNP